MISSQKANDPIRIRATFTGTDSLGYAHGERYALIVEGLTIRREGGGGACPYGSLTAFFANWSGVERVFD